MVNFFRLQIPASVVALAAADALILLASILGGLLISYAAPEELVDVASLSFYAWQCALFVTVTLLAVFAMGMHQRQYMRSRTVLLIRLGTSFVLALVALAGIFYVAPFSRIWLSAMLPAMIFGFIGLLGLRLVYRGLADTDFFRRRILVIGAGPMARHVEELEEMNRRNGSGGFVCVGYVPVRLERVAVTNPALVRRGSIPDLVGQLRASEIVVACETSPLPFQVRIPQELWSAPEPVVVGANALARSAPATLPAAWTKSMATPADAQPLGALDERMLEELMTCRLSGMPVWDYLAFIEQEKGAVDLDALHAGWLINTDGFLHGNASRRAAKWLFDTAAALVLLIATLPLTLTAALAIWLEDRGPVFYEQERVGRQGRTFRLLKFRSMRSDAEKDGVARWAAARDPRVTRVGALLRRTRIDEIPQVVNILRGDMSFVGPRPERPAFVNQLSREIPYYACRHAVKPGLTGWAQINYAYGASVEDAREKLQYDLYYVKNHTLFLDLMILVQTVRVVLWPPAQRG